MTQPIDTDDTTCPTCGSSAAHEAELCFTAEAEAARSEVYRQRLGLESKERERLAAQVRELEHALDATTRRLDDVLASSSWRIGSGVGKVASRARATGSRLRRGARAGRSLGSTNDDRSGGDDGDRPMVSIVVLGFDTATETPQLDSAVAALRSQTMPLWELIVIGENAASAERIIVDPVTTVVRTMGADSRKLLADVAARARGDYVLVLDPECPLAPNALERAVLRLSADPAVEGVVFGELGAGPVHLRLNLQTMRGAVVRWATFHRCVAGSEEDYGAFALLAGRCFDRVNRAPRLQPTWLVPAAHVAATDGILSGVPWLSPRADLTVVAVVREMDALVADLIEASLDMGYLCLLVLTGVGPGSGYDALIPKIHSLYDLPAMLPEPLFGSFLRSVVQRGRRTLMVDFASGVTQPTLSHRSVGSAATTFVFVARTAVDCAFIGHPARDPDLVVVDRQIPRSLVHDDRHPERVVVTLENETDNRGTWSRVLKHAVAPVAPQ